MDSLAPPTPKPKFPKRPGFSETTPLIRNMSSRSIARSTGEPLEKVDSVVYWSFWVLGSGVLLAWNVLLCSIPLFIAMFPLDSPYRKSLASYITTSFTFSNLIALGWAQRGVGVTSPTGRIQKSLYILLILSVLTAFPIVPFIMPMLPPALLFVLLISLTIAFSVSTSYLQNSLLALASMWGSTEMLAVLSGQGGVAAVISVVQVAFTIMAAVSETKPELPGDVPPPLVISRGFLGAGMGLWVLATGGVLLCLYARKRLMQHAQYHARVALKTGSAVARAVDYAAVDQDEASEITDRGDAGEVEEGVWKTDMVDRDLEGKTWVVFKKNWALELAVAFVFIVTLAVFPPITTTIHSVHNPPPKLLEPSVFVSLHFFMFNLTDYLGRTFLPTIPALFITSPPVILLFSFLRLLFVPLFLLCNTGNHALSATPVINSDTLYFLIIIVFGLSNGYVSSLCMITASSPELNRRIKEEETDVAGTMAGFCLVAGLAGGSLASFGVGELMPR